MPHVAESPFEDSFHEVGKLCNSSHRRRLFSGRRVRSGFYLFWVRVRSSFVFPWMVFRAVISTRSEGFVCLIHFDFIDAQVYILALPFLGAIWSTYGVLHETAVSAVVQILSVCLTNSWTYERSVSWSSCPRFAYPHMVWPYVVSDSPWRTHGRPHLSTAL